MPVIPVNLSYLYMACLIKTTFVHKSTGKERSGSATGFFVHSTSGKLVLVSNRHVFDISYSDPGKIGWELADMVISFHTNDQGDKLALPRLRGMRLENPGVVFHSDDTIDIGGIALDKNFILDGESALVTFNVPESMLAQSGAFATQMDVGEIVSFPGFPEWYDKNGTRPIFRTGKIVSDPRVDYRMKEGPVSRGDGNQQLAFEAFSFSGNSGSPIFLEKWGNISLQSGLSRRVGEFYRPPLLVGINAGHLYDAGGSHHSGISYMYKSTAILEFIRLAQQC